MLRKATNTIGQIVTSLLWQISLGKVNDDLIIIDSFRGQYNL